MQLRVLIAVATFAACGLLAWKYFGTDSASRVHAVDVVDRAPSRRPAVPTTPMEAEASTPTKAHVPKVEVGTQAAASLYIPRERLPDESDEDFQKRMRWTGFYDDWIRRARLTPDQEAKLLQRIADAQANYEAAELARLDLAAESHKLREARMTPEQKKRLHESRKAVGGPGQHDLQAMAQAQAVYKGVSDELEPGTPKAERDATDAWQRAEQGDDLLDDALVSLAADVFTERQLASFRETWSGGDFAVLLRVRMVRSKGDSSLARH